MKKTKMDQKLKKIWVKALRSGKYQQGKYRLCGTVKVGTVEIDTYCCLGVLLDTCVYGTWVLEETPSEVGVVEWGFVYDSDFKNNPSDSMNIPIEAKIDVGIEDSNVLTYLAESNDEGMSFDEIADWIEENL